MSTITLEMIRSFRRFERRNLEGKHDMFISKNRKYAKINLKTWRFITQNYFELKKAYSTPSLIEKSINCRRPYVYLWCYENEGVIGIAQGFTPELPTNVRLKSHPICFHISETKKMKRWKRDMHVIGYKFAWEG